MFPSIVDPEHPHPLTSTLDTLNEANFEAKEREQPITVLVEAGKGFSKLLNLILKACTHCDLRGRNPSS